MFTLRSQTSYLLSIFSLGDIVLIQVVMDFIVLDSSGIDCCINFYGCSKFQFFEVYNKKKSGPIDMSCTHQLKIPYHYA